MISIFERTAIALATLSPAVPFAMAPYQGDLPDLYIVYQLLPSPAEQHADGVETERANNIQITIWNKAGLAVLPDVDAALLAAGFMKSDIRQLPRDQGTGYYGLAIDFLYLESKE